MLSNIQKVRSIAAFASLSVLCFAMWGGAFFAQADVNVSCTDDLDSKTDKELEIALRKCEQEIADQRKLLIDKQKNSVTIERDIDILEYKINQARVDIKAREIQIVKIGKGIAQKEGEIGNLVLKTENMQASLAELLRKSDELETYSLVETMLSNESLSDFFIDVDNFDVLKKDINITLGEIREVKQKTQSAKEDLEEKERNERGLKIAKEEERRKTSNYKTEKQTLLSLNREEEKRYEETIAEKEKIKNEIRNRIFRTVGGTEMKFEEALKLILPYEEKIGVEAELVLAVLTQESAIDGVIGRNLGRCTYNQSASNKSGTVMSDSQKGSFLAIISELGMLSDKTPVSCPIPGDGQYGGAMGPAQFMPNTWWDVETGYGYKNRVGKVLNIGKPSPFINLDAFVGTMLYLSDARDRCSSAFSSTYDVWRCTAAKYYSGLGNTTGKTLTKHMNGYGAKVAARAQAFREDIDLLGL